MFFFIINLFNLTLFFNSFLSSNFFKNPNQILYKNYLFLLKLFRIINNQVWKSQGLGSLILKQMNKQNIFDLAKQRRKQNKKVMNIIKVKKI